MKVKERLIIATIFLLTAGFIARQAGHGEPVPLSRPFALFPDRIGDWEGREIRLPDRIERKLGVTDYLSRVFVSRSGEEVFLYVGYYSWQEHGKMVHSPNNCLPGNGWHIAQKGSAFVDVSPYQGFTVNHYVVENGSAQQVVFYWYQQSGGRIVTNEYLGRVYLVLDAFRAGRTDAALIRVSAPVQISIERSSAAAVEFLRDAYPLLMQFLPHEVPTTPTPASPEQSRGQPKPWRRLVAALKTFLVKTRAI